MLTPQIGSQAAQVFIRNDFSVSAIRPAPADSPITRILFSDGTLEPSENRTIFVGPVDLTIRGDMTTYGTSGILPFRMRLDYLHRNMMLGNGAILQRACGVLAVGHGSWKPCSLGDAGALSAHGDRHAARTTAPLDSWIPWRYLGSRPDLLVRYRPDLVTGCGWADCGSLRVALGLVTPSVSLTLDTETHPMVHAHPTTTFQT